MLETKTYTYKAYPIRVAEIDGNHWFLASDIKNALGYSSNYCTGDFLRRVPDECKLKRNLATTLNNPTWLMHHSGFRSLAMRRGAIDLSIWCIYNIIGADAKRQPVRLGQPSALARFFTRAIAALTGRDAIS